MSAMRKLLGRGAGDRRPHPSHVGVVFPSNLDVSSRRTSFGEPVTGSMERVETVIVGGGQAGLAMSYHFAQRGREHLVLERTRVAERWRS